MPRLISADALPRATPTPQRGVVGFDGTAEARAMEGLGRTIQNIGADMQRAQDDQALFEARRKLDAWERDAIYDPEKGAINKLGKDALDLPQKIPADYDKFAGEVASSLTTTRQRQAFQELSQSRRNQVADWSNRHALQQRDSYERGQFEADMQSVRDRAAMFATDPARIATEMAMGRERAIGFLRSRGRSEEEINQVLRDQAEKTHVAVLDTLLAGDNWKAAKSYLDKNAEQMNPAAVLRLSNTVQKQEDAVEGAAAAHGVMSTMQPQMQPTDLDRVMNITIGSESGGRQFDADGKPLTSSAGAIGIAQVMPKTAPEAAKLAGLPWDEAKYKTDADYNKALGKAYLGAMIKRYGGDMQKAWAAYNAGPGRVDEALATAKEQGDPEWQIFLPKETQDYVAKNMRTLDAGGGAQARPTLQDVHANVREVLKGQSPQRLKIALDESTRLYKEQTDAIKQRETEALAAAQQGMLQNGGSWNALPPEVRNAVPAGKVDELLTYGQKIAKGEDRTDPIVFNKMATDDKWLKGMTDAEFFWQSRKLSEADAQQMAKRRGSLLSGEDGPKGPGDLNYDSFNATLNARLNQMGLDPTPKDSDKQGPQRIGAIRQAMSSYVLAQQQQAGKKFNDAEMAKVLDQAIARQVNFRHIGFFGGETVKPERLVTMQAGDIPPAVTERLKKDFAAAGVPSPSDGDLLGAYLQMKLR
jgi:soluble lytic murein transglycosylase